MRLSCNSRKCHFWSLVVPLKAIEVNWSPFTYILANLITNSIYAWLTKDFRSSGMFIVVKWMNEWITHSINQSTVHAPILISMSYCSYYMVYSLINVMPRGSLLQLDQGFLIGQILTANIPNMLSYHYQNSILNSCEKS